MAQREDWDRVNRWPGGARRITQAEADAQREATLPPEVMKEGRRRREWRRRMTESRELLERAPYIAQGYTQMEEAGGTIGRNAEGNVVVSFPPGGMRRR